MKELLEIIRELVRKKFTGDIEINFNQGGVRGVKKIIKENL